ncbi:uncharacterized protein LOC113272021 [Papaver somniferum]|uniref:uncharacterized protein LOC113272021 n=1 Tax=Papaver somniferum TaxID=3469 RepID=UPI000E6F792C|nr:uncharacterized protein LOC113272021 [Papaver somniferum]
MLILLLLGKVSGNLIFMPRVKIFLWKTLSDCLPVKEILGRHTPIDIQCPLCNGLASESIDHLFTKCVFTEAIWRVLSIDAVFYKDVNMSYKDWCLIWLKDGVNRDFYSYVLWYIWKYRCKVVFHNVCPNPYDLIEFIKKDGPQFLDSKTIYLDSKRVSSQCDLIHPSCLHERKDILEKVVYIYFDAAFNIKTKKFSYGIVEMNNEGYLLNCAGGSGWYSSPEEAESRACRAATRWRQFTRIERLVFLNDNMNVINSLRKKNFAVNWISRSILQQAHNSIKVLANPSFVYIRRSCNNLADNLAKFLIKYANVHIDSRSWEKSRKESWLEVLCKHNNVFSFL